MTKTQIKDLLKKAANKRKGIGAIPVGLRFTIAGVKMFVEAQFDIYNKVHINIVDEQTKKTVVKIDGVVRNKKEQAEKLLKYVVKNTLIDIESTSTQKAARFSSINFTNFKTTRLDASKAILQDTKKIIDQLSQEVNLYNKTPTKAIEIKAKTGVKTPIKTKTMATKTGLKADGSLKKGFKYARGGRVVKAGAASKPAAKRKATKKTYVKLRQTGTMKSKEMDAARKALKPGKRVSKAGNVYYEYRANRSDLKPTSKGRSL